MLFEGIFLPLTTPFHNDGRLFGSKLAANVEHYSRTPAAGMVVLSGAGEPDALTDQEMREVLETAIAHAADEKVMVAEVGRESVAATLAFAEHASTWLYDAIAVHGPTFCEDESFFKETLNYFRMVADRSALPVLLVSEPGRTLGVETIMQLSGHPNVFGVLTRSGVEEIKAIKAATVEVKRVVKVTTVFAPVTDRMLRAASPTSVSNLGGVAVLGSQPSLRTRTKQVGFQVLSGSTAHMLDAWNAGASGAMPLLGACAPQACYEVWQAFRDGDPPLAEEKQERLRLASAHLEGGRKSRVDRLKWGCDFNGYYGGRPRLPLLPLTEAERVQVEEDLAGMRN